MVEHANSTWDLSILDSWRGLMKGISTGLINLSSFNPEEYEYYDHPMHGDMHVMVPGKFIAFKGVFVFFLLLLKAHARRYACNGTGQVHRFRRCVCLRLCPHAGAVGSDVRGGGGGLM